MLSGRNGKIIEQLLTGNESDAKSPKSNVRRKVLMEVLGGK